MITTSMHEFKTVKARHQELGKDWPHVAYLRFTNMQDEYFELQLFGEPGRIVALVAAINSEFAPQQEPEGPPATNHEASQ